VLAYPLRFHGGNEDIPDSVVRALRRKLKLDPKRRQTWRTFLVNHMAVAAACDFFVVPTLTFKLLYGFVVLSHDRRRILHVNVTAHPTAEWTAQQITEAFPGDVAVPRYLHRARDSVYGDAFRRRVVAMGLHKVVSARQAPWQSPYCERVIGSIRRECTDHVIAASEHHLRRILRRYAAYYNGARCHQSLSGNAPEPREVERGVGRVRATAHLGGLHHRYTRAA
jgi:putative transposase